MHSSISSFLHTDMYIETLAFLHIYSYCPTICPRGIEQFKVPGLSAKNSHGRQNKSKRISKIRDACEVTGKDTEKGDDA